MTPCQACHKPFQHTSLSHQCWQFCKMKIGPKLLSPMTRAWFTYSVSESAELKNLLNGSFFGHLAAAAHALYAYPILCSIVRA